MTDLTNQPKTDLQHAIEYANWQQAEVARFRANCPSIEEEPQPMPAFTWGQMERQLADLAPEHAGTARTLVSAIRKQARFKPREMVLREILIAAGILMDSEFGAHADLSSDFGEGAMT